MKFSSKKAELALCLYCLPARRVSARSVPDGLAMMPVMLLLRQFDLVHLRVLRLVRLNDVALSRSVVARGVGREGRHCTESERGGDDCCQ
jgi:hypothetical protein